MTKKGKLLMSLCLLAAGISLFAGCAKKEQQQDIKSLFSWKSSAFSDERQSLFQTMKQQGIQVLYQDFPSEMDPQQSASFLKEAAKNKIDVYYLTGAPK